MRLQEKIIILLIMLFNCINNKYYLHDTLKMFQTCHYWSILYSPDQTKIMYQLCNDRCLNIQQKVLVGQQYEQICFDQAISVIKFNYQKDYLFVITYQRHRMISLNPKIYAFKFHMNNTIDKNYQIFYNIKFDDDTYMYDFIQHNSISMSFSSQNKMAVGIGNILFYFTISYERLQLNLQFKEQFNFSWIYSTSSTAFIPQNQSYLLFSSEKLIMYNLLTRTYSVINDKYSYYVAASLKGQFIVQLLYTNQFRIYNYQSFGQLKLNMFFSFVDKTRVYEISNIIISDDQKFIAFLFIHNFLVFQVIKQNNQNYNAINLYEQSSRSSTISKNGNQLLTYNYQILLLQRWYLCPDGKYFNNLQCQNCSSSCATCHNSADQCTSCKLNQYLQNQVCYQCNLIGCSLCYNFLQCLQCNQTSNFQKQPINKTCVCQQGKQFYGSVQKCYSPINNCKSQNNGSCMECNSGFILKSDKTQCFKNILKCLSQTNQICYECSSNYDLIESKCIHKNRFNFKITLNTTLLQLNLKQKIFIILILTAIGQTDPDFIVFSKITDGSIIVQGSVSSRYGPQTISYDGQYNSLVRLFSQSRILQIPITSFSVVKSTIANSSIENNLNFGMVAFLTIGLFAILIIIFMIVYKCATRSNDQEIEKIEQKIKDNKLKDCQKNNKDIKQISKSETDQYLSENIQKKQQI